MPDTQDYYRDTLRIAITDIIYVCEKHVGVYDGNSLDR